MAKILSQRRIAPVDVRPIFVAMLLESAGFTQTRVCTAIESEIPEFSGYFLDANEQGTPRQSDSLFVKARNA